jgi:hypothetical protein
MLYVSKKILSTALLDYIINLTTLVPDSSSFTEPGVQPLMGSLDAEAFISSMNLTASLKRNKREQRMIGKHTRVTYARLAPSSRIFSNTMSRMAISRIFSRPTSRMAMSHSG